MKERIQELTQKYFDQIVAYRRDIHQHPELAYKEERTMGVIADALTAMGIEHKTHVGGYGVVGLIQGGKGAGKCIGIRADIDALPFTEDTGLPFSSVNEGVMHACGHDMHTAGLLGVAHVLNDMKDTFKGIVKLVFQPAEEHAPTGGAPFMIKDGVLENPHVDAMIALHVWPSVEVGHAAVRYSSMMASSDRISITVKGKSSHASQPQDGFDAIVMAGQVISALQSIVARNVPPLEASVVTIGTIHGGNVYNAIADSVQLEGTLRNLNFDVRDMVPKRIEAIVKGITEGMGGSYEFKYAPGYPPVVNNPEVTEYVYTTMKDVLGDKAVIAPSSALGGEDFGFFSEKVPSCYFWLGVKTPGVDIAPIHNSKFFPDEKALTYGCEILSGAAIRYLND